jgi:hypothetical protein
MGNMANVNAPSTLVVFQRKGISMFNKEPYIEAVRKMPEDASLDDTSEEIANSAAVWRGEEAADAGDVVPHDEGKKRFASCRAN